MKKHIVTIIIAFIVSFFVVHFTANDKPQKAEKRETVFEKVMRTKTIECGYFVEPPFTIVNEVTGEPAGLSVDLIEIIASKLSLDVVWKEQINFGTFTEDLNTRRYDAVCGSILVLPRAGTIDYTQSYAYAPIYGYVKPDNTDFDQAFGDIDWSTKTVSGIDGEGATTIVQDTLPQAQLNVLPQNASVSEMLMAVDTNKADIGFAMPTVFENFKRNNPGKLRQAQLDRPLYTYAVSFGIARSAHDFKALLNNALTQLIVSGELQSLANKHDPQNYFTYPGQ